MFIFCPVFLFVSPSKLSHIFTKCFLWTSFVTLCSYLRSFSATEASSVAKDVAKEAPEEDAEEDAGDELDEQPEEEESELKESEDPEGM